MNSSLPQLLIDILFLCRVHKIIIFLFILFFGWFEITGFNEFSIVSSNKFLLETLNRKSSDNLKYLKIPISLGSRKFIQKLAMNNIIPVTAV